MGTSEFCGTKSRRTGKPCLSKAVYSNGRCKFHGGLSAGPGTTEGKSRSAMNGNCPQKSKPLVNQTKLHIEI
jgi:hypothetical protein